MPDLTTRLASLALTSPILAASGTFGYGNAVADLMDGRFPGALITPTLTVRPRPGNPMPRTVEAAAGLLHSTGLPNPGLAEFVREALPRETLPTPTIVSILGETLEEWALLASELSLARGVAALELNLCPSALLFAERADEQPGSEAERIAALAAAVAVVRRETRLPLIAKLPALLSDVGGAALQAADAGADAIAVSHAFPGVAVRVSSRGFRLPGTVGGLSGPCIKPLALYQVWRVSRAVSLPIIGGGGAMTADDVLEFLVAGASAVAIGIASMIHPATIAHITAELEACLAGGGFADIAAYLAAAG